MDFDFDLFVIGGGSGGVRAARLAAERGKRVAMAEGDRMGGTCVIRGCVPKKLMLFASDHNQLVERAKNFGWETTRGDFDWPHFQAKLDAHVNHLERLYTGIAEKNDIRLFLDFASLDGPNAVTLSSGVRFTAARILIATGAKPFVPEFEGSDLVITSNEAFDWSKLPKSILIVGGGYIASEFAGIFNGLNVKTTQIYRGDLFLRGYDVEMRNRLANAMRARGIDLRMNTDITKITAAKGGTRNVHFNDGSEGEFDVVMYATGRVPNMDYLGLDQVGIDVKNGAIAVNEYSQTNIPSIYAIGDVTNRAALTPVAIREAVNFIKTVYDDRPSALDYARIPTAIFTRPEFGTIGLSEEAARATGEEIDVYANEFTPMQIHFGEAGEKMLAKLIVRRRDDLILGIHIMGEGAGEFIQLVGIPFTHGITKTDFDLTIAVHPTQAEELVTIARPRA